MSIFYALNFIEEDWQQKVLASRSVSQLNEFTPSILEGQQLVESDNKVIALVYEQGKKNEQIITLKNPVNTAILQQGKVSDFLQLVETEGVNTLKALMKEAQEQLKFNEFPFKTITDYPCQVVLSHFQVYWHSQIQKAVDSNSIEQIYASIQKQLTQIIQSDDQDLTVTNCLTILISLAEFLEQRLSGQLDQDSLKKIWDSMVKFVWASNDLFAITNEAKIPYGYENVGKKSILVRTPLTEKVCSATLNSKNRVIHSFGPPGTGKTETFKDFCYYLGKNVVVINCSDKMTKKSIGKLLEPVLVEKRAQCYDEFNRLLPDELNYAVEQLKHANYKSNYCFQTFNVNINSSKLPENFSKVSALASEMTVPDSKKIARVHLARVGIIQAKDLASKLVDFSKDKQENFVKLSCIDLGLRFLLSCCRLTARVQRSVNDEYMALAIVIKFNFIYRLPFKYQQSELFNLSQRLLGYSTEKKAQLENFGLIPYSNVIKSPFCRVYETLEIRHGSTVLCENPLETADAFTVDAKNIGVQDIKTVILPLNFSIYGSYDNSQTWQKGPLENAFIEGNQNSDRQFYILLVGDVNVDVVEQLNTVLDDNKKLRTPNGDEYILNSNMRLIMFTNNIDKSSPANISRVGIVQL